MGQSLLYVCFFNVISGLEREISPCNKLTISSFGNMSKLMPHRKRPAQEHYNYEKKIIPSDREPRDHRAGGRGQGHGEA